jgi:hypothetical protein
MLRWKYTKYSFLSFEQLLQHLDIIEQRDNWKKRDREEESLYFPYNLEAFLSELHILEFGSLDGFST